MNRKLLSFALAAVLIALAIVVSLLIAGDKVLAVKTPGVRLVYAVQADRTSERGKPAAELIVSTAETIKRRFDPDDLRGVQCRAAGDDRIEVLASSRDSIALKTLLARPGKLSFHVVVEDPGTPGLEAMLERLAPGGAGPAPQPLDAMRWLEHGPEVFHAGVKGSDGPRHYVLVHATPQQSLTHDEVPARPWSVRARRSDLENGAPAIAFEVDDRGAGLFGDLTEANLGRAIAIAVDGVVMSAPVVNSRIERHGMIECGKMSSDEINNLVGILNAGPLPASLAPDPLIEEPVTLSVGPPAWLRNMLKLAALALGGVAVMLCGFLWIARSSASYRPPGV